jgi:uncharacterized membrane protein YczE
MQLKELREGFFPKKNFGLRLFLLLLSTVGMGFFMSLLLLIRFGVDPFTMLMKAIAVRSGLSIGNVCAIFNVVSFVLVLFAGQRNFGFGTIANMFLYGYSLDFFNWLVPKFLPDQLFSTIAVRVIWFIPVFMLFIICTSLYMVVRMGTSPYDAIPMIVAGKLKKVPFRMVRMAHDFLALLIGFLLGGDVGVFTVVMPFLLGPMISFMESRINARWHLSD